MERKAIPNDLYSMNRQTRQLNADLCRRRSGNPESGFLSLSLPCYNHAFEQALPSPPNRCPDVQGEEPQPQGRKADRSSPAPRLSLPEGIAQKQEWVATATLPRGVSDFKSIRVQALTRLLQPSSNFDCLCHQSPGW